MDLLQVNGNQIINSQSQPVRLRGTCVGGWMNMENFINGYPGVEHGIRAALADEIGPTKAQFLMERWLDYFLTEDDIALIKQCGANVVRLALNYRHFESDANPYHYHESGFEQLERAVQWCTKHGLYVILDLHAVQGWQNPDWHSDNPNAPALLWEHLDFQNRFVALWEELARRYVGNTTIAGYDVMNEPQTRPLHGKSKPDLLNQLYRRVVTAIRAIDPDHIIFLEGDGFGAHFNELDPPFAPNLAYSGHSYSPACFGPGAYPGTLQGKYWDRQYMGESHSRHQAFQYAQCHNVPMWMGEFGAVYHAQPNEADSRLRALDDQIDVFEEFGAHWTTWTYKDVGIMGWVTLAPESEYMQRMAPVLQNKYALDTDSWLGWLPPTPAKELVQDLSRVIAETLNDPEIDFKTVRHSLTRAAMAGYTATIMEPTWAKRFKGMSENDIDRVMQSFALANCKPHEPLLDMLQKHMSR